MKEKRGQLLNDGFLKLFLTLSIPSIFIGLIAGLYNLVDAIFVGQFIGPEAVGAVSLSYALTLPNWAVTFCLGIGSATLLSRAIGSKDTIRVSKLPGNIIILGGILSVGYLILIQLLTQPLLEAIGGSGKILEMGTEYLRFLSFGFPLATLGLGLNLLIRGEGRMRDMLIIAGISNLTNIALDYILIVPFKMGVEGAALATVISEGLALALILSYMVAGRSVTRVRIPDIRVSKELLPQIMKVGISPMMVMLLMALQHMLMFRMVSEVGSKDQMVLLAATLRLFTFFPIFTKGVSEGMQPVVGTCFGAKDVARAMKAFGRFTFYGTSLLLLIYIPLMLFPRQVLSLFITDMSMLSDSGYFRLFFSTMIFQIWIFNSLYYFLSIGKGREGGILVLTRQLLIFIPLVFILPVVFGDIGVWVVIPICDLGAALMSMVMIRKEFRRIEGGKSVMEVAVQNPQGVVR